MADPDERPLENWHSRARLGVHFDLYPGPRDTKFGRDVTYESMRREIERLQPGFVQSDCKGTAGFANYRTAIGTPSPGLAGEKLTVLREVTRDLGLPLGVAYAGLWDAQAVKRNARWARIDENGSPGPVHANIGAVAQLCPSSGYVDELMIPMLLEVIDRFDVDGFWIDADGWVARPCWCERCSGVFEDRHGSRPPDAAWDELWDAWIDVNVELYANYARKYVAAVQSAKPECLVAINWLYSVPQSRLPDIPVDFLSGDAALAFAFDFSHVEARAFDDRGRTWDLMLWMMTKAGPGHDGHTMKSVAQVCQEAAVTIAAGGCIGLFDMPQETGHLIDWHQQLIGEILAFCRAREALIGGTSIPQVAVLNGPVAPPGPAEPLFGMRWAAKDPVRGATQVLLDNHFHVDVIGEASFLRRAGDYAMIVVPDGTRLTAKMLDALESYLAQGGRVLAAGAEVAARLAPLAGLRTAGAHVHGYRYLETGGEAAVVAGPWQPLDASEARGAVLKPLLEGEELGADATELTGVALQDVGAGRLALVPGALFGDFYRNQYPRNARLVGEICDALAVPVTLQVSAPSWVHASLRRVGEDTVVHLVNNGTDVPLSTRRVVFEAVPPSGSVEIRLRMEQEPAHVRIAPAGAVELTWSWKDGELMAVIGELGIHAALVIG